MKKILFLCAVSTLFSLCAEILVWQDNLKKNTWISADKKTPFPVTINYSIQSRSIGD